MRLLICQRLAAQGDVSVDSIRYQQEFVMFCETDKPSGPSIRQDMPCSTCRHELSERLLKLELTVSS